jgi:hypothetical protein
MTILNLSDPWPQIYMRRWNSELNEWNFGYEDKSVIDVVANAVDIYTRDNYYKPTILFAGPKATLKIKDLFIEEKYTFIRTTDVSGTQKKEFLGMELVFTIDDGLWIA